MTCPVRGRALIINMENFSGSNGTSLHRKGSDKDVKAMKQMLEAFKFEVEIRRDRSAEDIISDIIMETQNSDHRDYGMFFLCIMSHGKEDGIILGSDQNEVKLTEICDILSPTLFSAMAGKPKLIVIQADRGVRVDRGTLVCETLSGPEDLGTRPQTAATSANTARDNQPSPVRVLNYGGGRVDEGTRVWDIPSGPEDLVTRSKTAAPSANTARYNQPSPARVLNVDDFFIFRPSFNSYLSYRHKHSGSLMISCLIKTFYKHACNKDMYSLYKMIQERVREETMKLAELYPGKCSGQTVTAIDTLSRQRKLYLFPGYNPPQSTRPRGAAS